MCGQQIPRCFSNFTFYMTGMLQSPDIGIKVSITPMRHFYKFKLECFSCWRSFGNYVEFYVNDVSIDELRKSDGMCYHTDRKCDPQICRCCSDSNIYIIEYRTIDLKNIRSFSCHMRFKDVFTDEIKTQEVSIPFNRQCEYLYSIFYPKQEILNSYYIRYEHGTVLFYTMIFTIIVLLTPAYMKLIYQS